MVYVLTAADREAFTRCRRAWDLGARARRGLEPAAPPAGFDLARALRDALAVYYFPGMWDWERAIVQPLADRALERSYAAERAAFEGGPGAGGAGPGRDGGSREEDGGAREDDGGAREDDGGRAWDGLLRTGRDLVERYGGWAPGVDRFTPLRVETDFEATVPDPARPGHDLPGPDGSGVRYRGRVDVLVADDDGRHWVVAHRVSQAAFAGRELLRLDEDGLSSCWGWQRCYLDAPISGTLYNEVRIVGDPHFRRTAVPRSRVELDRFEERLAGLAQEMTSPALQVYPSPTADHCRACSFRAPCLAMNDGSDVAGALAAYRPLPPDELVEGRLGGTSWSMGRGAAPPRFGRRL